MYKYKSKSASDQLNDSSAVLMYKNFAESHCRAINKKNQSDFKNIISSQSHFNNYPAQLPVKMNVTDNLSYFKKCWWRER